MNRIAHTLSLIALCLALVASSVTMAVARGQAATQSRGGMTAVICTGYGVKTITLDANGDPVSPMHPCPHCLAGLAAYLPPGLTAPQPLVQSAAPVIYLPAPQATYANTPARTCARGPPLVA